ncbi:uncharacterized protein EMH_0034760 [Eimeria mitis]|uniref:Uncharacterized protein n=1 Tax=Eimeria mitis TaxID=44415 RepID=U6JQL5_9EIME|nr:uncharacterized protein EMH_0034760 [Eimeria mitis]CDJ27785.1 hypothetical protein, conserved [Eimeria mitis]
MTRNCKRQQKNPKRTSIAVVFLPLCLYFFASSYSSLPVFVAAATPIQQQLQQKGVSPPTPVTYSYQPENAAENTQTRTSILYGLRGVRASQSLCKELQTTEEAEEGYREEPATKDIELPVINQEQSSALQHSTPPASNGDEYEYPSLSNGETRELLLTSADEDSSFLGPTESSISPQTAVSAVHTPETSSLEPPPATHRQLQRFDPAQLGPAAQYAQYLTTFLPGQQQQQQLEQLQQLQQLQQLLSGSGRGGSTPAALKKVQRRAQAAAYANSITSHPLLQGLLRTALTTVAETLQSVSLADVVQSAVPIPPPLIR